MVDLWVRMIKLTYIHSLSIRYPWAVSDNCYWTAGIRGPIPFPFRFCWCQKMTPVDVCVVQVNALVAFSALTLQVGYQESYRTKKGHQISYLVEKKPVLLVAKGSLSELTHSLTAAPGQRRSQWSSHLTILGPLTLISFRTGEDNHEEPASRRLL